MTKTTEDFLEVRRSSISGRGVFAKMDIKAGTLVFNFYSGYLARESTYRKLAKTDEAVAQSGIRLLGDLIIFNRSILLEDFVNHSDNANILYHCGFGFAFHDIKAGEEITNDYRLYLPERESIRTQEGTVNALSAIEALRQSTRKFQDLLKTS